MICPMQYLALINRQSPAFYLDPRPLEGCGIYLAGGGGKKRHGSIEKNSVTAEIFVGQGNFEFFFFWGGGGSPTNRPG